MNNFTVGVSRDLQLAPFNTRYFRPCAHVRGYLGDYETRYVTCDEPVRGRFVAVYREERGQIQMCEFEVFSSKNTGKHTKMQNSSALWLVDAVLTY